MPVCFDKYVCGEKYRAHVYLSKRNSTTDHKTKGFLASYSGKQYLFATICGKMALRL